MILWEPSVSGIYDLLGNTWEWTASQYKPPGRPQPRAEAMRVLRGASWIDTVDGSANHRACITTRSVPVLLVLSSSAV